MEVILLGRVMLSQRRHDDALQWAKDTMWGYDQTADDMKPGKHRQADFVIHSSPFCLNFSIF